MKIEVGKFYKTRNGAKVTIYKIDARGHYPVHGALYNVLAEEDDPLTWLPDGAYNSKECETEYDIISEWEEPKPRKIAWVHKASGSVILADQGLEKLALDIDKYIRMPHLDEPEGK